MSSELEPTGRRERKKRATYLALRAAALDLVSQRGFANVTVEDIAEAVDVSPRTFFNYFTSKEDALVGDDAAQREAMRMRLVSLPPEVPPLEALEHVLVGRLEAIAEDLDLSGESHEVWARRFAAVHAQPEVALAYAKHLTALEHLFADALVERLGGDESRREYAALVAAAALAALRTVGAHKGDQGGITALVERLRAAFDLMEHGFALAPANAKGTGRRHR
jgi:AcrR family transcriptional regulator